jgi:hypothetical protein
LDTKITPELAEEGKTRDLVRVIQELRKKAGLSVGQEIAVAGPWFPSNSQLRAYLQHKVLARKLLHAPQTRLV